jgi:thiamine kinase-like enzyme
MRLTKKNLTSYLLDKGFLDYESVISGKIQVSQMQSRNSIFKVHKKDKNGVFVKQLTNVDIQNSYLLQKDATSLYLIGNDPLYKKTATYLPEYYGYDTKLQVLVTEFLPNAKNLYELTVEQKKFSLEHAETMAEILSTFHFDIQSEIKENKPLQFYTRLIPWALQMHQKMEWPESQKIGMGATINNMVMENKKFQSMLKETAELWEATSLIHGDVKWLNFICTEKDGHTVTKLIDWEIADIGDPLWDVAGVLQSYLTGWVTSYENNLNYEKQLPGNEFMKLENSKPATKHFWESYTKKRGFSADESYKALIKSIKYTAARLIQTAFESNVNSPQLLPNSIRMLQLSYHLFENPEKTGEEVLGLK